MNQQHQAEIKFNQRFDEQLYKQATEFRSSEFASLLIGDALALCGHPVYQWVEIYWSCYASDAQMFLKKMLDN